jgi:hypothetical protein
MSAKLELIAHFGQHDLQNYVFRLDFILAAYQYRRPLHRVAQLANVPRPAMLLQYLHGLLRHCHAGPKLVCEEDCQIGYIAQPFAKRWKVNGKDGQTII